MTQEDGCAIKLAIEEGTLDALRLGNYKKTGRELAHQARKEQSVSKRHQKSANKRLTGRFTSMDKKHGYGIKLLAIVNSFRLSPLF